MQFQWVVADTGISFVCDTCISFLQRVFRTCRTFGSHWAVTQLWNSIKSGIYIAKHFVFMLIIFQVDRHSVSIRFFCVWKKIPLLLNRTVCGNSVIIFTVISGTKPFVLFHALLDIFWSEVPNTNQAVHITLLDHFPVGRIIYSMRLRSPLQVGLLTDLISF